MVAGPDGVLFQIPPQLLDFDRPEGSDEPPLPVLRALGASGQEVWIDSREVRGGDALPSTIKKAIEDASAFAVVVSRDSWGSSWVSKELRHALKVQKERGSEQFRIIPLLLDNTGLGAFEGYFDEEPMCIPVSSDADGVEAAVDDILVALGTRDPAEMRAERQPRPEPLEELVLAAHAVLLLELQVAELAVPQWECSTAPSISTCCAS